MPSGTGAPSAVTTYSSGTGSAWTGTTASSLSADDGTRCSSSIAASGVSNYLRASGFGFAIPTTGAIVGIKVDLYASGLIVNTIYDASVYLVSGSAGTTADRIGSNKALGSSNFAPTGSPSPLFTSYGGPTDTWGATLTPAQVNSANFGVEFQLGNADTSGRSAQVDYVLLTVYYQPASTGTLAVTEAGDTLSMSGAAKVQAAIAIFEAADLFSASGSVRASGSLSIVEAADGIAASAAGLVHASLTVAEAGDAFAAAGGHYIPIVRDRHIILTENGVRAARLSDNGIRSISLTENGQRSARI